MIQFRQKDFSNYILRDAIRGAGIGLTAGTLAAGLGVTPKTLPDWVPGHTKYNNIKPDWHKNNNGDLVKIGEKVTTYPTNPRDGSRTVLTMDVNKEKVSPNKMLAFAAGTTLLGAALGALVGTIRTMADDNRRPQERLTKQILPRLRSKGMVEGKDFTLDPKKANEIPTKVCIVLSSVNNELQTVINTKDDPKLKKTVDSVVRKTPGRTQVSTQNNRFNEITITTEKNTAANVNQVVSIIESFVESGYPVYIVEVG